MIELITILSGIFSIIGACVVSYFSLFYIALKRSEQNKYGNPAYIKCINCKREYSLAIKKPVPVFVSYSTCPFCGKDCYHKEEDD